jgi:hypothetical protein
MFNRLNLLKFVQIAREPGIRRLHRSSNATGPDGMWYGRRENVHTGLNLGGSGAKPAWIS